MLSDLKERIAQADAVSFDVFDTLFVRPLSRPEDLFDVIGEKFGMKEFRRVRTEAQTRALQRMQQAGQREITLDGIYDFLDSMPVPASILRDAELELELALTIPNPRVIGVFKETLARKPVVITSDVYLPRSFFDELFRRHSLEPTAIFISSERNATKRDTGELFDIVARELGVPHARILHVGGNAVSDVKRAKQKGLAVHHYVDSALPEASARSGTFTSIASNIYRVIESGPQRGSFAELGFRYGGPAATGFIDWIARKAKEDRIDLVLFISRDGHILERLASQQEAGTLPRFAYFKGSRAAFTLAATDESNFDTQIAFFLADAHGLRPIDVLERIGVEPPSDEVMDDLEMGASTVVNDANTGRVRDFVSAYRAKILQVCTRNRRELFRYLLQAGVEPGMRIAMIDVGWNGTTQEAFDMALAKLMKVDLYGYYLCLNESKECLRRKQLLRMDALFSSASIGADCLARVYANRVAVELCFSAPHDALIGYEPPNTAQVTVVEKPGRIPVADHAKISREIGGAIEDFSAQFRSLCHTIGLKPDPLETALPLVDFVENMTSMERDIDADY